MILSSTDEQEHSSIDLLRTSENLTEFLEVRYCIF